MIETPEDLYNTIDIIYNHMGETYAEDKGLPMVRQYKLINAGRWINVTDNILVAIYLSAIVNNGPINFLHYALLLLIYHVYNGYEETLMNDIATSIEKSEMLMDLDPAIIMKLDDVFIQSGLLADDAAYMKQQRIVVTYFFNFLQMIEENNLILKRNDISILDILNNIYKSIYIAVKGIETDLVKGEFTDEATGKLLMDKFAFIKKDDIYL